MEDLPAARQEVLLDSRNPQARRFGLLLEKLQSDRSSGRIDHQTFVRRANDLVDAMHTHKQSLTSQEFITVNDDVGLQYLRFSNTSLTDDATVDARAAEADHDPGMAHALRRGVPLESLALLREMHAWAASQPQHTVPLSPQTARDLQGLGIAPDPVAEHARRRGVSPAMLQALREMHQRRQEASASSQAQNDLQGLRF